MKLVITGGRDYDDFAMFQDVLSFFNITELYVGDCPTGADRFAANCFESPILKVFDAKWDLHGKAAGPIRNREMLKAAGQDALVVAFPGGRGTENCVKEAIKLNMAVVRVEK